MGFSAFLEVPHGIVRILEVPYEILCIIMHEIQGGTSKMYTIPRGPLKYTHSHVDLPKMHKIQRGTSKKAQKFWEFLEVHRGILCIFVSSSRDFVQFWMFLVGFCAFLEVPRGIVHI
jgi:hypothetical protein